MASPRERDHRAVTMRPSDLHPSERRPFDPRVTTRPSDVRPSAPHPHARRHHFHDVPPWPHQRYNDYVYVDRGGWWPRWYPYWDPSWYTYWWYLYDYYGGDAYPEYAEYARDAVLRQHAPQWGLTISGHYGTQIGIQPYGVSPATTSRPAIQSYRSLALDAAKKIFVATGSVLFGYRYSPWGSEFTVFGTRAGLQRWANEQAADTDVWYAASFDVGQSPTPLSEVSR